MYLQLKSHISGAALSKRSFVSN